MLRPDSLILVLQLSNRGRRSPGKSEELSLHYTMSALIYNVTVKINLLVREEWLHWMQKEHIPEVMASACFRSYRLLHLEGFDDDEGTTYAIQYTCPSEELFEIYQRDHAPALQKKHLKMFEGKFVAFRTVLTLIAEG